MAANLYPALNDVMYSELVILTEKVADLCPEIRGESRNMTGPWANHVPSRCSVNSKLLWKEYFVEAAWPIGWGAQPFKDPALTTKLE